MLRQLSNEIFNSSISLAIVLDDFHHIRQSKVVGLIQPWLENIPSQVRLIIASRVKPPFSLGHLRAEGKLTELDMSDLRFTVNEGTLFLENYFQDNPLLREEMEMLVKRTDGWATGLTLAVLALNKQDDRRTFISSFNGSHTYLREFFMESVLQQQPRPVQSFLLKTAILKNLTGSLCDALTGENNGAEMLSWLWNENLFITRSEEQDWYHYNDLFAEMLQDQLQKQLPDQIPELHRKAAIWYSQKYVLEEALYHLFTIQAWEEAAALIETLALREIEQLGEDSRLLRWLRQLPETVVQQHKTLLFLYVRLASGAMHPAEVNRYLSTIEQNIINKPENERTANEQEVLSEIRRIKLLSVTGYPLQSQLSTGGEHDATWQLLSQLSLVVKSLYFKNEPYSEQQVFEVYEAARLQKNLFVLILAGSSLVKISYLRGELRHSEKLANSILQQAYASRGKLPETASVLMASLSQIYFAWNQLERAKQALSRAIDIDPNPTSSNVTLLVSILRAKILAAEGKNEEARSVMENAREFHLRRPSGTWSEQELTAYQAWFRLRDGDTAGAAQLLTAIEGADLNNIPDLVQAEIFLSLNQPATSEDILNRILGQGQDRLHYEPFLIARIMLSIALFKLHRVNESQQLIMELLRNAALEGFIRPFIDFATYLTPILKLVLHTNNLSAQTRSFIQKILILSGYSDDVLETRDSEVLDLAVSASITPREQQIMHLVAEGLSNGEIALRLSIAESTVKTHLANVYLKLGANSRMQAVGRMKALNLS